MAEITSEYILSTHERNLPRGRFILNTIIFFLVGISFLIIGIYYYNTISTDFLGRDNTLFKIVCILIISFGIIVILLGMFNLTRKITIKLDKYGIQIIKRKSILNANWNEIMEIKNSITYVPSYRILYQIPNVMIKTQNWKFKIKEGDFNFKDLKDLFLNITEYSKDYDIKIMDALGWLPDDVQYDKYRKGGYDLRLKEYKIVLKIGVILISFGLITLPFLYLFNLSQNNWFVIPFVCIFIGGLFSLCGFAIIEEKRKMKKKK